MKGESGYGTLVAYVEYEVVVGLYRVAQPLYLGRCHHAVVVGRQQGGVVGVLAQVVVVEALAAGVGEEQRALVVAVDVAEVGGVGIDGGSGQWGGGQLRVGRTEGGGQE